MITRLRRRSWILAALLAVALAPARSDASTVHGDLRIYVLDVGQGDAILLVCPHGTHRMLIDSGDRNYPQSQAALQQQLQALLPPPTTIQVVVSTHPHEDHVAGLPWVLSTFRVKKFIDNGRPYTKIFKKVRTEVNRQVSAGTLLYFSAGGFPPPSVADFCPAANLQAELLVPHGFGHAGNVNNNSVAVVVTYDGLKFLFTGDAEKAEERLLVQDAGVRARLSRAIFYKAGHHGAETSSTADLLDALDLQWAAVSSGCKNVAKNRGHRHPRAATLRALLGRIHANSTQERRRVDAGDQGVGQWTTVELHEGVYLTTSEGSILFVSDGQTVERRPAGLAGPIGVCVP